jgi:hypothetical protein
MTGRLLALVPPFILNKMLPRRAKVLSIKITANYRYIERNPNIKISQNIADTIWISGTYRIFN